MAKDKQTIILETSASLKNGTTVLDLCNRVIDTYIKETFTGLTDQQIIDTIKSML
jgi:hypothetical protein